MKGEGKAFGCVCTLRLYLLPRHFLEEEEELASVIIIILDLENAIIKPRAVSALFFNESAWESHINYHFLEFPPRTATSDKAQIIFK